MDISKGILGGGFLNSHSSVTPIAVLTATVVMRIRLIDRKRHEEWLDSALFIEVPGYSLDCTFQFVGAW